MNNLFFAVEFSLLGLIAGLLIGFWINRNTRNEIKKLQSDIISYFNTETYLEKKLLNLTKDYIKLLEEHNDFVTKHNLQIDKYNNLLNDYYKLRENQINSKIKNNENIGI